MFEEKFTEFVTLHSRRAPLSDNEAAVVRHSCRAVAAGTESWSADRSVTTSLVFLLRGDSRSRISATASNTGESVTNWGLSRPAAMSAVASTPGAV